MPNWGEPKPVIVDQMRTLTERIPERLAEETHNPWTGEPVARWVLVAQFTPTDVKQDEGEGGWHG